MELCNTAPGAKYFPPGKINHYIDEIEAILINLIKKLFRVKYVEWRPLNSTMANAVVLFALTKPGDIIMVQSMRGGGNISYHTPGPPGLRGLIVKDLPPTDDFRIDISSLREMVKDVNPKLFVVGGSKILFPFRLKELREIADEIDAKILYDGAHIGPLITSGMFQDPLREGADILTTGTHKLMGGPVGRMILTNDEVLAREVLQLTYPAFIQTRDQNKYAAAAYVLAEMLEFGKEYARQIVSNAKALARALDREGFDIVGKDKGYTMTHQVFIDAKDLGAAKVEKACLECNLLLHKTYLLGDEKTGVPRGLRLSVQETTRLGMKEKEMEQVAHFIRRAVDGEETDKIADKIEEFLKDFQTIPYSFEK